MCISHHAPIADERRGGYVNHFWGGLSGGRHRNTFYKGMRNRIIRREVREQLRLGVHW